MFARGLVDAGCETRVAASARSALCDDDLFSRLVNVREEVSGFCEADDGSDGDADAEIFPAASVHVFPFAVSAVLSGEAGVVEEIEESELTGIADEDDVSAGSAVSAVGAALGNICFAPETAAAVAAVSGFDSDDSFIDKHGSGAFFVKFQGLEKNTKKPDRIRAGLFSVVKTDYSATAGITETSFLVKFPNLTVPSTRAKRV